MPYETTSNSTVIGNYSVDIFNEKVSRLLWLFATGDMKDTDRAWRFYWSLHDLGLTCSNYRSYLTDNHVDVTKKDFISCLDSLDYRLFVAILYFIEGFNYIDGEISDIFDNFVSSGDLEKLVELVALTNDMDLYSKISFQDWR